MLLNIYIPEDKEPLLAELAQQAKQAGRSENDLILEAIERQVAFLRAPAYRTFEVGTGHIDRGGLYSDRTG